MDKGSESILLKEHEGNQDMDDCLQSSMEIKEDPPIEEQESLTPVVAGVEENVNSRFIDYTKATPWEHLISDIERSIKAMFQGNRIMIHQKIQK